MSQDAARAIGAIPEDRTAHQQAVEKLVSLSPEASTSSDGMTLQWPANCVSPEDIHGKAITAGDIGRFTQTKWGDWRFEILGNVLRFIGGYMFDDGVRFGCKLDFVCFFVLCHPNSSLTPRGVCDWYWTENLWLKGR